MGAALAFPKVQGLTVPTNPTDPNDPNVVIPLILTQYTSPNSGSKVGTISTLPSTDVYDPSNSAYGGLRVAEGGSELSKINLAGTIDTPAIIGNTLALPYPSTGGVNATYGDLIAMYTEGRSNNWNRVDPLWYRDPYGRMYYTPRILTYQASYIEGVPTRLNFTMTLAI